MVGEPHGNTFDPYVYPFTGFVAALNRPSGSGVTGFSRQYARAYTDNAVGNMLTSAVLPSVLHQDPRYYRKGEGSAKSRIGWAFTRLFVARYDDGHWGFNGAELTGNAAAAAIGNLYYPHERTGAANLQRLYTQFATDGFSQVLKEFWPDISKRLKRKK